MSVDLDVNLREPVAFSIVLPKVATTVREILGLSFIPQIVAEDYVSRIRVPLSSEKLCHGSSEVLIGIPGEPETASVGTYLIDEPQLPRAEQGVYAYVNVSWERSPLEYALAAAFAVTLGRELGVPVIDDACFYTSALSLGANEFIDVIRVGEVYDDYRVAAQVFYDALPRMSKGPSNGLR